MSQIYPVQFLNDLHNYFPEILYGRPDRFRNVQDLLDYIRQVAQINPYNRGLNQHISNYRHNTNQWEIIADTPNPVYNRPEYSRPVYSRIYVPNMARMNSSIFGTIIDELMNSINEEELENVVVQPTATEIENATIVYSVNSLQEDICTICQDNIESNEVRRIMHCRHYFHRTCIDTWFQTNVHCPTCRHDIRAPNT